MIVSLIIWRTKSSRSRVLWKVFRFFRTTNTPEVRGRRLLRRWLTRQQRTQFDALDLFDVVGCNTGRRYRIHYGYASNIEEVDDDGNPTMGWCFVPKGCLVPGDVMLAQKIALETDELAALSVAHTFRWSNIVFLLCNSTQASFINSFPSCH
jgi:hypothetical protein